MKKEGCFKDVVNQIKMLFGATYHSSSRSVSMRDIVVGFQCFYAGYSGGFL